MINQNYVRMNATSSIAWSLVWSAYPNLECFGNGLLYAFEPWSGHFEINPPVWATAHTTQFTEVGWMYLPSGHGAGVLPGGGTYVTLVSPKLDEFTIVIETLQGQCFYHAGCYHVVEATRTQRIRLELGNGNTTSLLQQAARAHGVLEVWMTNKSHYFQRQSDIMLTSNGTIHVEVPVDAIITLTTMRGATKQGLRNKGPQETVSPRSMPFPLPFAEGFDGYDSMRDPPFFADQGGAFEIVEGPVPEERANTSTKSQPLHHFHVNKVLQQQVLVPPIAWNGRSPDPFTLVGGVNWTDIEADVHGRLSPALEGNSTSLHIKPFGSSGSGPQKLLLTSSKTWKGNTSTRYVGLCVRISRYHFFGGMDAVPEGYCFRVFDKPESTWTVTASGETVSTGMLPLSLIDRLASGGWVHLTLSMQGARLNASIDGKQVVSLIDTSFPFGQVALQCGYHHCQFDDLTMRALPPSLGKAAKQRLLLAQALPATFDYHSRSCDPAPRLARRRRDFTGFAGFTFTPKRVLHATARAFGSCGWPSLGPHS